MNTKTHKIKGFSFAQRIDDRVVTLAMLDAATRPLEPDEIKNPYWNPKHYKGLMEQLTDLQAVRRLGVKTW